ncbi:MAG: hypothetical protein L0338_00085 [Acidobacteria bacterium]|nr:hypothetical protein [Acidobacteriota bacterium]
MRREFFLEALMGFARPMLPFQSAIIHVLDRLLAPFKHFDPLWALLAVSLVTTLLFLLVFRCTTDPLRIRAAKNGMQARLLEVRIFKDSPAIILAALAGMVGNNLRYLRSTIKPTVLLLPLLVLLLIHLDGWFRYAPLRSRQAAVVTVKISGSARHLLDQISLEAPPGVSVETAPLRLPDESEVSWAVRGREPGKHPLRIRSASVVAEKTLVISDDGWDRVAPRSVAAGFWNQWLYPGEAFLPPESMIERIEVGYPALPWRLLGWEAHWLLLFFLFSCGFGFVASRLLGVTM